MERKSLGMERKGSVLSKGKDWKKDLNQGDGEAEICNTGVGKKDSKKRVRESQKGKAPVDSSTRKKKKLATVGDEVKPVDGEDNLLRGKKFTPEEDKIIESAVANYINSHNLGDEGLKMVMNCRSYREIRSCWKEIGVCIPNRTYNSIYRRAHIIYHRSEKHAWSEQEIELLKELYEKHGNKWKLIGEELGRHRFQVKDKCRLIKPINLKKGKWSQEEYQALHDMVNLDMQMKVASNQEKKSKHGMLRDNIHWGAISDKLTTRSDVVCCQKWYRQLASSLVEQGKWSTADDYYMIGALYRLDIPCIEDVDWDGLLKHRSGDVCRERWHQMVRHLGPQGGSKPFSQQVGILAVRYCPHLAQTREAWDNTPAVQ